MIYRHNRDLATNKHLRRAFVIYVILTLIQAIICAIIIIPVSFVSTIGRDRFNEFLSIYVLTSGPTVLSGFYLGQKAAMYM